MAGIKVLPPKELKEVDKILKVEWIDACSYHGWDRMDQKHQLSPCESVGFLVGRNKKQISIAQSVDHHCNNWSCVQVIPMSCVRRIRILK